MDRADIKLGFLLAYLLAAALHAGLAFIIYRRRSRYLEIQVFAGANLALSAWHILQLAEYSLHLAEQPVADGIGRWLAAGQLILGLSVLVLFFHLFATFERVYRRRAPSLRAAITSHVHRHRGLYVPVAYLGLVACGVVYLLDSDPIMEFLARLRGTIGPTSAYVFGGTLFFMTFVLFPARPGQEKVVVASLGRSLLMIALGLVLGLIAVWHASHPLRTALVLLPLLHIQSVAFCVFLALVRYEFSFMDRYIRDALRLILWSGISLLAYYAFNRIQFLGEGWGRYATSLSRLGVLLLAVTLGSALSRACRDWVDRLLFDRDVDLANALHRFAERLSQARTVSELTEGAIRDISNAVHPKKVRILRGDDDRKREIARTRRDGSEYYRLVLPLGAGGRIAGWLLLGNRRNFYPYFDAERRYLSLVAELLGSALEAMGSMETTIPHAVSRNLEKTPEFTVELERIQKQLAQAQRELSQAREEQRELRERLDPELVTETLAMAQELGEANPQSALDIIGTLGRAYEYLLVNSTGPVPLSQEMAFAQSYLALEKLRSHNRLEVTLGYDAVLKDQEVPRRLLKPLVDNALVHGLSRELRSGSVSIHANVHEDRCVILVEDNGRGFKGDFHQDALKGEGGLARVLRWLRSSFGDDFVMQLENPGEIGMRLRIELPRRNVGSTRRSVA